MVWLQRVVGGSSFGMGSNRTNQYPDTELQEFMVVLKFIKLPTKKVMLDVNLKMKQRAIML